MKRIIGLLAGLVLAIGLASAPAHATPTTAQPGVSLLSQTSPVDRVLKPGQGTGAWDSMPASQKARIISDCYDRSFTYALCAWDGVNYTGTIHRYNALSIAANGGWTLWNASTGTPKLGNNSWSSILNDSLDDFWLYDSTDCNYRYNVPVGQRLRLNDDSSTPGVTYTYANLSSVNMDNEISSFVIVNAIPPAGSGTDCLYDGIG